MTNQLFTQAQLIDFVQGLREWPGTSWITDSSELAVSPFTTFYFHYDSLTHKETSLQLVDIHQDFEKLLAKPYVVATHPESERPHPYGSKRLPDLRKFARETEMSEHFLFKVSNEKNHSSSPAVAGVFWKKSDWGDGRTPYSHVQFYYRWQWWLDNRDAWRRFVLRTIDLLRAKQVYSGFAMANPLDTGARSEVAIWERSLAPYFYGLDIDFPFGMADELMSGIRPPTWAFLLSNDWRDRLDLKRGEVNAYLDDPRISIIELQAGQWIELGDKPELCPIEDGVPELPALLNQLLRPIRNDDLGLVGLGQWDGDPNERFDRTDSRRWLGRFDADSDWPSAELRDKPPRRLAQAVSTLPTSVQAGQPCPRSGWWFTPAKVDSRRYFRQGEVVPAVSVTYGTTVWQWDTDQSIRS